MSVLEQIMQEIEDYEDAYDDIGTLTLCPSWVKEIIKKHLSADDINDTTNDGMISISDERLWDILFEEACVEGQQAERIHTRLKEICGDGYADGQLVYDTWICPSCGEKYEVDYDDYDHCPKCGQAIDLAEEGAE